MTAAIVLLVMGGIFFAVYFKVFYNMASKEDVEAFCAEAKLGPFVIAVVVIKKKIAPSADKNLESTY